MTKTHTDTDILTTPVNSTNIKQVSYDPFMSNLTIEFHNGTKYEYVAVPKEEYEGIIKAASVGRYFQANIKGKYDFLRLG